MPFSAGAYRHRTGLMSELRRDGLDFMTPEAANYLAKAREDLSDARQIAGIGLATVAARSAYYAAFHAAEALIVEKIGKIAKSHSGVRTEFARLAKDDREPARP